MKIADSGMPEELYWNSLFDIPNIIRWLDIQQEHYPIVEVGCGYGTFTLPIAEQQFGELHAFDIDPKMIDIAKSNAVKAGLDNIRFSLRDILAQGTGLNDNSVGMVLLFNILHFDDRRALLAEASRILKPPGVAAIIHWRKDIETPRGPRVDLRPDRESIFKSIAGLNLSSKDEAILEPYHWGIKLVKEKKEV